MQAYKASGDPVCARTVHLSMFLYLCPGRTSPRGTRSLTNSRGMQAKQDRVPLFVVMGAGSVAALAAMIMQKPKKEEAKTE